MLTAMIGTALAAPLIHDSADAEGARALAEERTGRADWEPRAFAELTRGEPVSLGGNEVFAVCGTDEGPSVDEAVGAFRGAVLYADPDIPARLEAAQRAIACHGAPTETLARVAFLAGVAEADAAEPEAASDWFRAARTFHADFSFDTDFPAELQPVFEASVPSAETYSLEVVPARGLTIDGVPPERVAAGVHLVRVAQGGFWVRTGAFADTIVWPRAVQPSWLARTDEEAARAVISPVLAVDLGEGTPFGLVAGQDVWTGTAGRTDWKAHLPAAPPAAPPTLEKRGSPVGPLALVGLGVVAAGVGGALSTQAFTRAKAPGFPDSTSHESARARYWAGWGVVAGGAGVAGAGLVWLGMR